MTTQTKTSTPSNHHPAAEDERKTFAPPQLRVHDSVQKRTAAVYTFS